MSERSARGSVLVTGAAGFIGMHVARAPARTAARGHRRRQLRPLLRRRAQGGAARATLRGTAGVSRSSASISPTPRRPRALFRDGALHRTSCISRRSPACATRSTNPGAYIAQQPDGVRPRARRLPARAASRTSSTRRARASTARTTRCRSPRTSSVDHPVSLYAATKKANELMAHSYSHLYRLPTTGLRFFTVYGPWGRPDMAPMLFTQRDPRRRADHGVQPRQDAARLHLRRRHRRRRRARARRGRRRPTPDGAPYAIYNIGNHEAVELETFIATLERLLGRPRDQATTRRCSRATCRRPTRRSTGCAR